MNDKENRIYQKVARCRDFGSNKYANDAPVLAEWTSASHTERGPRRSKPHPGPTPPSS